LEHGSQKQSLKESIYELLFLTKVCLTSVWFWVPPLFALFVIVELYMICINPLLLMIGPGILIVAALIWEDRRTRAQYGLKEVRLVKSSDMLFTEPRKVEQDIDVERLVKEYSNMIDKQKEGEPAENGENRAEDE